MTPRQEKFCIEYAKTGNATAAYKLAGYQCKNDEAARTCASRLLMHVDVQRMLREINSEVKKAGIASVEECQLILSEIARDPRQNGAIRVQALNTLLRVQGAFSTQISLNATVPVVISGAEDLED